MFIKRIYNWITRRGCKNVEPAEVELRITRRGRKNVEPAEVELVRLPTHISSLPTTALSTIFNMLPAKDKRTIALVCSEWRNACYQVTSWNRETFVCPKNLDLTDNPTLIASLKSRSICKVAMTIDNDADDSLLSEVLHGISTIVQMSLDFQSFNRMMRLDPQLNSMLPANTLCRIYNYNIRDHAKKDETMKNLEGTIALTMAGIVGDVNMQLIVRDFKTITHLNLFDCRYVTDSGIGQLTGQPNLRPPRSAAANNLLPMLEHLVMENCQGLTDAAMYYLRVGQPLLKYVRIYKAPYVTGKGLVFLAILPHLEELHLVNFGGLMGPHEVQYLFGNDSLRVLKLAGVMFSLAGLELLIKVIQAKALAVPHCRIRQTKSSNFKCIYEIHM